MALLFSYSCQPTQIIAFASCLGCMSLRTHAMAWLQEASALKRQKSIGCLLPVGCLEVRRRTLVVAARGRVLLSERMICTTASNLQ